MMAPIAAKGLRGGNAPLGLIDLKFPPPKKKRKEKGPNATWDKRMP